MRVRSSWLFHPKVKATWVAIAAGSLAGLAVVGACSDAPVSRVAGPSVTVPEPRLYGAVGALAHLVKVCVDPSSTPGTYNFTVAQRTTAPASRPFELPSPALPDPDPGPQPPATYTQAFLGPYTPGDALTTAPSIILPVGASVPVCVTVFERNDTPTHANNRMQNTISNGIVNPYAVVNVTLGALPPGSTYNALCANDDPLLPQTPNCAIPAAWSNSANYAINQLVTFGGSQWKSLQNGNQGNSPAENTFWTAYTFPPIVANPIYSSANVFHGSTVTYKITVPTQTGPCVLPNAVFGLGAANGFTLLGLAGNVIDIGSGATLIKGDVGFGPTNSGTVKKASVVGNLTNDFTSTVNIVSDFKVSGTTSTGDLSAASAAATAASANLDALPADQTFGNLTTNTSFTNPGGGTEVVDIASVNMIGKTITITGDADDVFIFNVAGRFSFRSSQMILSGGVRPSNIIWNFTGTTGEVIVKDPSTSAFGVFLSPDRSFNGDKSTIVGAVMGGLSILIHSGGQLLCEESVI